jgi:hypothetical protein
MQNTILFKGHVYRSDKNGYYKGYRGSLHRAIWMAWHGPVPYDCLIHHHDGNPSNNDITNLECVPIRDHIKIFHLFRKYKCQEKLCEGCGKSFMAKTKRSRLCIDCVDYNYHHNIRIDKK